MKTTYYTITFEPCSQKLWKWFGLKAIFLGKILCENFKEKNKNSICSELPKIAMLSKKAIQCFRG